RACRRAQGLRSPNEPGRRGIWACRLELEARGQRLAARPEPAAGTRPARAHRGWSTIASVVSCDRSCGSSCERICFSLSFWLPAVTRSGNVQARGGTSTANAASSLIFPCYSRNFTSVTFSLLRDELSLCWIQEFKPYRENYESSSSQKTSHPNRGGGKRSIALRWVPRAVRL